MPFYAFIVSKDKTRRLEISHGKQAHQRGDDQVIGVMAAVPKNANQHLVLMLAGEVGLLRGAEPNVAGLTRLVYPAHLCKILGAAKLLGVSAILVTRVITLMEWAYAGFTFKLLGAAASHTFFGDSW
jgi:hypothetical protein